MRKHMTVTAIVSLLALATACGDNGNGGNGGSATDSGSGNGLGDPASSSSDDDCALIDNAIVNDIVGRNLQPGVLPGSEEAIDDYDAACEFVTDVTEPGPGMFVAVGRLVDTYTEDSFTAEFAKATQSGNERPRHDDLGDMAFGRVDSGLYACRFHVLHADRAYLVNVGPFGAPEENLIAGDECHRIIESVTGEP